MVLDMDSVIAETFPAEIKTYLSGAAITVVKNRVRSSVYHIENQAYDIFLKVTPKEQMKREALMMEYLHSFGSCPRVLHYTTDDSWDYLITERIKGSDAANDENLAEPDLLTEVFAESLLYLHGIRHESCPVINGFKEMVIRAENNYREIRAEKGILRYLGYTNIETAYSDMIDLFQIVREDKVVIHGDYCLPNVLLHDFKLNGFIDVGYGGIGDRHYDIFWGLWSLQFNLKSNDYSHRFIQTYGKHLIDQERLRFCGLLSVFNGFRGQDYYEL
ncbi:aminoglycoside 3'-phosphotransferase [Paenibacillus tarimensis]